MQSSGLQSCHFSHSVGLSQQTGRESACEGEPARLSQQGCKTVYEAEDQPIGQLL